MIAITALLFNKKGAALDEIEMEIESVLWRLGQTGTAKFSVDFDNPKCTRSNLQPGNGLLLDFDVFPDWGGVIDFPVNRTGEGISITAYEGDRLLDWRVTGKNIAFSSTIPGAIVQALLSAANADYAMSVSMGLQYLGGSQSRNYHYDNLLTSIRALRSETGYDYAVVPEYVAGRLSFKLHWYERRGADARNEVLLSQGENVGIVTIDEQGPVGNQVIVVGAGDTWQDRPVVVKNDYGSRNTYGLRQLPKLFLDISDEDTLDAIAQAILDEYKAPHVRATLAGVTDSDPAGFSEYHVGDIVTVQGLLDAGEWAFDEPARILSRQLNPDGTCALEVEQWRD